ncbi:MULTISPECIES: Rha family transcriptional regulator [Bacillus amyloliquefaciens group]|uniref:Rha family transcriptional regulator n=1 Tax=Bacillus amyloliquefaciens group TaxID=1938374 RepID=UPI000F5F7462|nr:Rha family transcriptional regulator [Bacillus velezensis]AZI47266.1 DNA-binding protein [Bacillus velezensis]MEC1896576.1 Rha family transcriptional regulator [Bacillus velezensis]MEC1905536.1 Rha family transcriptional regulator [Bacillus velezensis]MEC1917469.1 Rha family transcriptional regulator [Bacillus velezensis]UJA34150.1 Rha family transcriptional regulator [Bacillus velezensis]
MQLNLVESNGQYLADSRDVAEVTGKRHSDLIRTIKGYIDTILTDAKLRSSDFFIASTYEDSKGEIRPRFLLTKKGCEMVANKMTGEKGILFTAAYVDQFNQMERHLQNDYSQLSPQLQQMIRFEQKQSEHDKRLNQLENNWQIDSFQQNVIQKQIRRRVYEIRDNYDNSETGTRRLFAGIHRNFRDAFAVPSYRDLRKLDFEDAKAWIKSWRPLF